MSRPIVVGVDGSPESLAAVEWAAREALRRDRPLRLVHASEWTPERESCGAARMVRHHVGRGVLHRAADRVARICPDMWVTDEHVEAPALTALSDAAGRAELLVVGARGLSGRTGFLVGSVAQALTARAVRPVVLIEAGERAEDAHLPDGDGNPSLRTPYRDVVVGIDVRTACDEVIGFAFEAARLRGARLHALHAWSDADGMAPGPGEPAAGTGPAGEEDRRGFLGAVLQNWRDKYPGVDVVETVAAGGAAPHLVRAGTGAGLLVVGRRVHDSRVGPHTGPVTRTVIHHARCPVAVVPHR
ncbi:universal stress protein [Streptomyces sp. NPDC101225]|uniref:universal stress protein n=1 Tax=Streptomyces sp. NPDC101225 TaxID=3366135 RepID=UPI00380ABA62